jgi:soluble lytic murein transglycosylase-like protein
MPQQSAMGGAVVRPHVVLLAIAGLAAAAFAPVGPLLPPPADPHAPAVDPELDPHAPAVEPSEVTAGTVGGIGKAVADAAEQGAPDAAEQGAPRAAEQGAPDAAEASPRRVARDASRGQRPGIHVLEPGDTVSDLAQSYGVSARELARANAVREPRALRPGHVLLVPDPRAPRPLTPEAALAADLPVERALERAAREFGWRPETVKAVAWAESRWNQQLVSHAGAIGVMQVQPATMEFVANHLGRQLDVYDLEDNATAGVAFLDHLYGRYRGDVRSVLAAYHQGAEALRREGVFPASERYIAQVMALRARFAR